jgi:hypothetical protein
MEGRISLSPVHETGSRPNSDLEPAQFHNCRSDVRHHGRFEWRKRRRPNRSVVRPMPTMLCVRRRPPLAWSGARRAAPLGARSSGMLAGVRSSVRWSAARGASRRRAVPIATTTTRACAADRRSGLKSDVAASLRSETHLSGTVAHRPANIDILMTGYFAGTAWRDAKWTNGTPSAQTLIEPNV